MQLYAPYNMIASSNVTSRLAHMISSRGEICKIVKNRGVFVSFMLEST